MTETLSAIKEERAKEESDSASQGAKGPKEAYEDMGLCWALEAPSKVK